MKTPAVAFSVFLFATLLPAAQVSAQTAEWRRVQAINPGSSLIVTRAEMSGASDRVFLFADADMLVALNLAGTSLDKDEVAALVEAASRYVRPAPGMPVAAVTVRAARVAPDGIWVRDRRIGDLAHRIDRIPRTAVLELREPGRRVGSKLGAIIGIGGGALIGVGTAINIATNNECGGSCADEKVLVGVSAIGIPAAGGLLGYHLAARRQSVLIYQRP